MKDLNINFNENKQVWDSFVSISPQRSIFVYSKFLDSLMANYDLVTCYNENGIVAGAVIVYSDSGSPIDNPFPFTQYQGLLLADNTDIAMHSQTSLEFKIVEYFIEQLTASFKCFSLCQSWRLRDLRPFQWHNYHEAEKGVFKLDLRYTCVLDLNSFQNFDSYFTSVRTLRKREFKKSTKTLKLSMDGDTDVLDNLHAKTFARQNIKRSEGESLLIKSILKNSLEQNFGKVAYAMLDDIPVSAIFFLYDDRTAYYLIGANDPEYRNTGSGTFLMMHLIKDAFARGLQEIDFVGANSPNRGDFKISFNSELKPYFITSIGSV